MTRAIHDIHIVQFPVTLLKTLPEKIGRLSPNIEGGTAEGTSFSLKRYKVFIYKRLTQFSPNKTGETI